MNQQEMLRLGDVVQVVGPADLYVNHVGEVVELHQLDMVVVRFCHGVSNIYSQELLKRWPA